MTLRGWLVGFSVSGLGCPFGNVLLFGRLMMRPRICPVVPVITRVFTHSLLLGVTGVANEALAGTAVPPALSPCQPLERPMSPCMRRSLDIVILPPRLGTSCHIKPLDLDMSTGLTMKKLAMYSTLPFAL